MTTPLSERVRLLMVEDSPTDAMLIERELKAAGVDVVLERVETEAELVTRLESWAPAIVLSDYTLPSFDGMRVIRVTRERAPDVPVIIVTGSINEETAVECMKAGAVDYVLKGHLERLPMAVTAALERARLEASHRRAQQELRRAWRAVEHSPAAIIMTDPEGRIQYVNPKFTEVTGYTPEDALGRNPSLLKSGRTPVEVYADLWKTIRGGGEWHGQLQNRRKSGELCWQQVSISPIRGENGDITHYVAVQEDITEQRRREHLIAARAALIAALNPEAGRVEVAITALDQLRSLLDADAAAFLVPTAAGGVRVEGAAGAWSSCAGLVSDGFRETPVDQVRSTGEPYLGADPPMPCAECEGAAVSVLGFPLATQEQEIGSVWLGRTLDLTRVPFTREDLVLGQALAEAAATALLRASLFDQTRRRLQRLMAVKAIDEAIASSLDVRLTLNVVLDHVGPQLGVDACSILLLNPHFRVLEYAAGRGFRMDGHQKLPVRLGEGTAGVAALERRVQGTADRCVHLTVPARAAIFEREGFVAHYAAPLITKAQVIGVLEVLHRAPLDPDQEWFDFLTALAEQASIAIENARLFSDLQRSNDELAVAYDDTIEGWVKALDLRDKETEGHTQRVTQATLELARILGMPDEQLVHVRRGALLHDIGKMAIPDAILLKPGPLTEAERVIMQRHTEYAHAWLSPIRFLRPAVDIPWCHHERLDGSGYPRGLRDEQIPLAARIFAVVDVWDALRSERVYRSAWPEERVHEYLRSLAGGQLDRAVVETFVELRNGM